MDPQVLPRRSRLLLVASTGGHLAELMLISKLIEARPDSHWVTFDHDQSRSLLGDRTVTHVPYVAPRSLGGVLRALPTFVRLLRRERFDAVVSTGAAVAVPALLVARLFRCEAHYVESVSRFSGPSLTGRILQRVPSVRLYTQHEQWVGRRWRFDVSIADSFRAGERRELPPGPPRIFVTVGTIRPYRFDALVDRVKAVLPADAEVTWQLGSTRRTDLPGTVLEHVSSEEFDRLAREATTVVTHAGVGSVIRLLELGARPVVVPRRASRGEHVDDHQLETLEALRRLDGVVCREAGELSSEDLVPPGPRD
ncbi:UDP-N-acetylglucosamine:LPS N-acetylglucosamine transferase [Kineococcus xinjiangensis]|uniref:UDP-N-acetylglucosamine:LPS N-acetylglucosamine transferase n=1 Tax=Kineococcus xinjiangensis TaxID=512762 RepID=A0A2S6ISW7_9ACTN|nr:glycosyltransferase [Kineococcus xinjiangensis]PPK97245.1 UDP-N-acetylglucosamine:LPS N-acetylglucosamine transferase [Kineococcus xinjiangensis]